MRESRALIPSHLSMVDFSPGDAPFDTTSTLKRKPIHILALDGGGVRGLSSLILLRGLMERVAVAKGISSDNNVAIRPSDFFDLIIGTGTGGISALFLGRLRMTVDEAIAAYQDVAKASFQPPALVSRALQRISPSRKLEQCVGNIVQRYLGDRDAPLSDPPSGSRTCRTAVLACTAASTDAPPHIFRSYLTSEPPSSFTVHEVARAAVAIPGTSLSVSLGSPPMQFVCASVVGYNNPAETGLLEAARNLDGRVVCLVSLGTGLQKIVRIRGPWKKFITACEQIAQDCEAVHDRMCRSGLLMNMDYFRFNVTRGLVDVIQEWTPSGSDSPIAEITDGYMRDAWVADSLDSCAQKLIGERIYKLIWTMLKDSNSECQHSDY